jgi:hypothetical protein
MTNIDGAGPMRQGHFGGRRRCHCQGNATAVNTEKVSAESTQIIYGPGRGGIPRGGGKGYCRAGKNTDRQSAARNRGLKS